MYDERELYRQAIAEWGQALQLVKVMEECAELGASFAQLIIGRIESAAVAEEIADVEIMCGQLREMIGDDIVDRAKEKKLSRLMGRLAEKRANDDAMKRLFHDVADAAETLWKSGESE